MIKRHKHFIETSIIWKHNQPLNGNECYDPRGRTDTVPWEHQSWGQVPCYRGFVYLRNKTYHRSKCPTEVNILFSPITPSLSPSYRLVTWYRLVQCLFENASENLINYNYISLNIQTYLILKKVLKVQLIVDFAFIVQFNCFTKYLQEYYFLLRRDFCLSMMKQAGFLQVTVYEKW